MMEKKTLDPSTLRMFAYALVDEERSQATIRKYLRDVRAFYEWLPGEKRVTKELTIQYKNMTGQKYAVSSANSMLTAINKFFRFLGWEECCVKNFKLQKQIYLSGERELSRNEYVRLLRTARHKKNERLYLLMQTICSTGIRVSELPFITVESVAKRKAEIRCKGKVRIVFLPRALCVELKRYAASKHIREGSLFITRRGKPMDRSNIWAEMKKLCDEAGVEKSKVFPHSLRHLFARTFYSQEKDIMALADLLGHSSVETTRIYTMSSGKEDALKIERLGLLCFS